MENVEHTIGHLTDYFPKRDIQSLQDSLARVVRLPIVIVDAGGQPVTKQRNTGFLCRCKNAGPACAGCWPYLPHPCQGDLTFGACPRTGLSLVSIPIPLEDGCLGAWILGQLRLTKPAGKTLKNIARTNAIHPQEAKKSMDAIPRCGWEELGKIVDFLNILHRLVPRLIRESAQRESDHGSLRELVAMLPLDNGDEGPPHVGHKK